MNSNNYHQSHREAKERCSNLEDFLNGFQVATQHIFQRANAEEGDHPKVRRTLGPRDIAAVILQGRLNEARCETRAGFKKIAIEALFRELDVVTDDGSQEVLYGVQVRVVIKDLGFDGKMIVVSYYKLYFEDEREDLPEVDYEKVW